MSFPNLVLEPEANYHATAIGVPVNGNNVIKLPFRKELIDPDKLVVNVYSKGSSVTDATFISVDSENAEMVINFIQGGVDQACVEATVRWSGSN